MLEQEKNTERQSPLHEIFERAGELRWEATHVAIYVCYEEQYDIQNSLGLLDEQMRLLREYLTKYFILKREIPLLTIKQIVGFEGIPLEYPDEQAARLKASRDQGEIIRDSIRSYEYKAEEHAVEVLMQTSYAPGLRDEVEKRFGNEMLAETRRNIIEIYGAPRSLELTANAIASDYLNCNLSPKSKQTKLKETL